MRFFLLLRRGCKKHLKIKGTRNYYFKTIGYSSRTKVKSSLILRRSYATWPWALTLGLKCYYLWELYHARVLVITLVLSTDVARSAMGLVWINKIWGKIKTLHVHLLLYQSADVCVSRYTMIHCVKCFWEIYKQIMVYSLSPIAFETFAYNVMLILNHNTSPLVHKLL